VLAIADRVTVLRGGKSVATVPTAGMTKPQLASLMVGREVLFRLEKPPLNAGEVRLALRDISALDNKGLPALRNVSLQVRAGEIVGVAGVAGNGQSELAEVIAGLRSATSGTIEVDGKALAADAPIQSIEAGIAYVPEDRNKTGSAPNLSVSDNLAIKTYRKPPLSGGIFLQREKMRDEAEVLVKTFSIQTPSVDQPVRKLSGGNLQKVILAREIGSQPRVLVASYPTRGLDIGATEGVRKILLAERNAGAAILLISEELDEIFGIADTIVVLYEGEIMGILPAESADRQQVGLMMAGRTHANGSAAEIKEAGAA
jgi:simple sugar transport system ATP-binding protein